MLITVNPQKPTCGAHVVLPVIMDLFAREALRTILMGEKIGTTHIFDFPNNLLLPYGRGYTAQLTLGGVSKIENIERFLPVDFFSSNTKILSLGQCYGYGYKMTLTNEDVVLREIEFSSQFTLELGIAKRFSRFQDWQTLSFCADGREMSYTRTLLSLFESMEDEEEYVSFELKSKTEQYQFTSAIDERMVEGAEEDEGSVEPFFNYTPEKEEQLKLLLADDDIDDYDAIYDAVADFYKDYKTLLLEITQLFENCGGVPPQKKTKKRKAREDNIESQDFDSNRPIFRDMVNYAINIGAISSTLSFLERICHLPLINLCRFILKTSGGCPKTAFILSTILSIPNYVIVLRDNYRNSDLIYLWFCKLLKQDSTLAMVLIMEDVVDQNSNFWDLIRDHIFTFRAYGSSLCYFNGTSLIMGLDNKMRDVTKKIDISKIIPNDLTMSLSYSYRSTYGVYNPLWGEFEPNGPSLNELVYRELTSVGQTICDSDYNVSMYAAECFFAVPHFLER
ncbi:unnamed protein product [Euphydryas editha]|uniref:Uncharacterized protein n=1 Tax=Euphydryas editha TaxID=104508 RepID=A0AAU9TMI6_EUPED|nr:unnamed protein product [Euphydryas editha]